MEKKIEKKIQVNSPFVSNNFVFEGQKDFDTEYLGIKIVDFVKKTGEGEDDFVVKKKVIYEKTPIQQVIDADKDSVGVENIIKQVLRTGDTSLLPIDRGDCDVDLVGAPEDLMSLKQMGVDAEAAFASLPEGLVEGMDMKSFVESMSQEKFDQFMKAVAERATGKEEKVNE